MEEYLKATAAIEVDHPLIRSKAVELTGECQSAHDKVLRLFAFVRDRIPYNLFMISMHPDDFRASFVLAAGKGYCVQKAVLLCALARSAGIPTRLALARIRNHRIPADLQARLGRNEFPGHGYNQFLLDGQWVSAAATFDAALCKRIGVPVVEFDGRNDAMLPAKALDGGPYIEYLEHYGYFADLPLAFITERTSKIWGRDKRAWKRPEDDTGFP
ncbi:MAG: transglutaminase domain-containing protein [Deltaproteobacteria bacterium]|nr:transglutaminase domain-containing protein [Deltaproteobacteria bacterium]